MFLVLFLPPLNFLNLQIHYIKMLLLVICKPVSVYMSMIFSFMRKSGKNKNKDSRSDDAGLFPFYIFSASVYCKIITGKEDIRCSGTYN